MHRCLQQARQMRRHRSLHEPSGGEEESQDWHCGTGRPGGWQFRLGVRQRCWLPWRGIINQFSGAAGRMFSPAQTTQAARPAIDVDPPQGRVPALIAAAGARISRRFFEFFAVNVRNPHTRRAQDRSAEQSVRSRRKYRPAFPGMGYIGQCRREAARPGEGQDDPLYGRSGTAFCRIKEP